jgi:hypothetical protein
MAGKYALVISCIFPAKSCVNAVRRGVGTPPLPLPICGVWSNRGSGPRNHFPNFGTLCGKPVRLSQIFDNNVPEFVRLAESPATATRSGNACTYSKNICFRDSCCPSLSPVVATPEGRRFP